MATLIYTIIAVAPLAFVAVVTLPVASVCEGLADVAEHTDFPALLWVVFAHERMWGG